MTLSDNIFFSNQILCNQMINKLFRWKLILYILRQIANFS